MKPVGKDFMVRNGYSRRSKDSCVMKGRWLGAGKVPPPTFPITPPPEEPPLPAKLLPARHREKGCFQCDALGLVYTTTKCKGHNMKQ